MEYIGIRSTYDNFDLHRELLQFDRVVVPNLENHIRTWTDDFPTAEVLERAAAFEHLASVGVLQSVDPVQLSNAENSQEYRESQSLLVAEAAKLKPFAETDGGDQASYADKLARMVARYQQETGDTDFLERLDQMSRRGYDYRARLIASDLSQRPNIVAIPILSSHDHARGGPVLSRQEVLDIAINAVPIPAASTPLERLLEFRSDPDVRADFLALHRWAASTATHATSPNEVAEEVEFLLAQHEKHMKVHRLEQGVTTLETVVTVGAGVLENLVKFKWGETAKLLFSLKKRSAGLMKAELTAPGKELAFLVRLGKEVT